MPLNFLTGCQIDISRLHKNIDIPNSARTWYYRLRLVTIIVGATIPLLVSLNISNLDINVLAVSGNIAVFLNFLVSLIKFLLPVATVILSLLVAISAAVEEFFHFGERWQHYRRTVEMLKIAGWQFFQLSGPYRRYGSHTEAYSAFASRVENIIQHDVEVYITEVVREPEEEKKKQQPQ